MVSIFGFDIITFMDKYDLTQEQWNEMVTAQLKEARRDLDAGTAKLVPYEEARERIMKRIRQAAEKERSEVALSYSNTQPYESTAASV